MERKFDYSEERVVLWKLVRDLEEKLRQLENKINELRIKNE